ncbi:MAG: acyl-CoA dehydrogenase family protein [Hyphomicrobiales bacterium]|nr:acyl-CoA dehydrogenase family protein [Hyphomicrobiales bacterium]
MPDRSFLSWPFLEECHAALQDRVEAWAKAHAHAMHGEDETSAAAAAIVRRLVSEMGRDGFLSTATGGDANAPYGKLDARSLCVCRETLARYGGLADFAFAMQGLGAGPISLFGSDAQKRRFLPSVAEGRMIAAFALSEQEAGSDVSALALKATRDGAGWRLDGEKTWISNAGIADLYVVFARTGEAPGAKGLSAFIVEANAPGFSVPRTIDLIAPHPIGKLAFDGVKVSEAELIGAPGGGFAIAMGTLDVFRSTVGAAALGFARRAMDEAVKHATGRKLFGGALSDLQLTRAKIADMALSIDAAALLIYRAAWTKDVKGARVSRESAMAKLFATEEAQKVIDSAVQIFGGLGVTRGNIAESLYREIRALRIYEGASEVQKIVIATRVLAEA